MARRRFRYDPEQGKLVELVDDAPNFDVHMVQGVLQPFLHNGVMITSRSQWREHMDRNNLVDYDPNAHKHAGPSIAEQQRERQATRELLWEGVNRTYSMGNKPRR